MKSWKGSDMTGGTKTISEGSREGKRNPRVNEGDDEKAVGEWNVDEKPELQNPLGSVLEIEVPLLIDEFADPRDGFQLRRVEIARKIIDPASHSLGVAVGVA